MKKNHFSQLVGTSQIGRVASRRASDWVTPISSSARASRPASAWRERDRARREKVAPIREKDRDRERAGERDREDMMVTFLIGDDSAHVDDLC